MKKRIITTAAFSACLALCAAVWPQKQPAEATPMVPTPAAVIATQPEVPEIAEVEEVIPPEEEKSEATLSELVEEADIVPKPSPTQTPPASEVPVPPEQDTTPQQEPEPASASHESTSDNMVYVPGFGWIESQGPNHAEYAEDMYENGNKIGIMG
ncbi:MAG TPA: hypothetical protein H9719_02685 [Candidatus Intestinimonas stercoravium]|nr:hypothetical protein [Candidatus Intestinimonas stercoravium]